MQWNLSKSRWYVRWLFWSADVVTACANWKGEFRGRRDSGHYRRHGVTGCQGLRVLGWGIVVVLLHTAIYGLALASVTAVPMYLFGFGYMKTVAYGAVGLGVIWALAKGCKFAHERVLQPVSERMEARLDAYSVERAARREIYGPGFFELVFMYLKAAKQKVCPMIKFID